MYAKGMTPRQISETIEDIYGFGTSEGFISDVTDKSLPQIADWQNRPLDEVYPVVYIDAIHYSVRDNGIKEANHTAFPKTEYQRYIVHMVRNTLKYVLDKDLHYLHRKCLTYVSEADILNMEFFEKTATQWRNEKGISGKILNIRNFALLEELGDSYQLTKIQMPI